MVAQIKAWGNSQGIRLSKELLNSIGAKVDGVKQGDIINIADAVQAIFDYI